MTDNNRIENSLIPMSSTSLVKVGYSIDITNKLIFESSYNWWNKLTDIWKKIFNAYIGKINNYPEFDTIDISCSGTTQTPSYQELEKIFQINHIEYHHFDNHDGAIEELDSIFQFLN